MKSFLQADPIHEVESDPPQPGYLLGSWPRHAPVRDAQESTNSSITGSVRLASTLSQAARNRYDTSAPAVYCF